MKRGVYLKTYDVIVIGAGPAGVSAALTLRNRGKSVGVIANPQQTTNLWKGEHISNYPGVSGSGRTLSEVFRRQLEESGAETVTGKVLSVMPFGGSFGVSTSADVYEAHAVIVATGISRRPLCKGETEFLGRGVSYCATCDGMLYRGKTVAAIGSGEEFDKDVRFLEEIGCTVLKFSGGKFEIEGAEKAELLRCGDAEYPVDCVFVLKDTVSVGSLLPGVGTDSGKIVTDGRGATNVPGLFAAGDCTGAPYQIAKAVGEGNVAALSACEYLDKIEKEI